MMASHYIQEATYWAITPNGTGGFTFSSPVKVRTRMEQRQEIFRNAKGDEVLSQAIFYVDADVPLQAYIALGDQLLVADPTTITSYRVQNFMKTPTLRGHDYDRKVVV